MGFSLGSVACGTAMPSDDARRRIEHIGLAEKMRHRAGVRSFQ
jgi:hypothetical protein